MDRLEIAGWGIDRRIEDRPGHPLEQPRPPQRSTATDLPAYADTIPLKGLSGLLRRLAYRWPDWKPRKWMTLMLADRVDVLESKLRPRNFLVAAGMIVTALAKRRRRTH